jgi:serine protease Do
MTCLPFPPRSPAPRPASAPARTPSPVARRLLAAAACAALGLAGCDTLAPSHASSAGTQPADPPAPSIDIRPSFPVRFATARISPAVVRLDVVTEEFSRGQSSASRSIGSGVVIDRQGHVLTNFHVAGRAKRIDITLANQEHVRGKLIGSDHWTDLALVQLDLDEVARKGLSFDVAPLGNSADVTLGQPCMAVGTPYGLSRTVTAGIVSNTDRFFDETNIEGYETGWFNNWIQMDAAINPGNSGGPLINLRGEVIGINTRGYSDANNLGFAIPIDTAKEVVKELLAHGKVTRSYIGVQLQPLQDLEKFYDLGSNQGVLVASVEKSSPAENAGLRAEDILLAVNGTPVNARFPEQLASVRKMISEYPVGDTLQLTVRRGTGPALTASTRAAATTSRPAETAPRAESRTFAVKTEKLESTKTEEKAVGAWGLTVRDLTRAYLRDARLPYMQGVLVTGTRAGSPADRAQMRGGDIILRVDNKPVTSAEELEAAVAAWEKDKKPVGVDVSRDRGQIILVVRP